MLAGGILAAVVVVGVIAAAVYRNRSRDDVHSVEHYHRQLHTLEEMRTHSPAAAEGNGDNGHDEQSEAAFPASAFRVSGSSTVRLTDAGAAAMVPPAPPPPVKNPGEPVRFVDSHLSPEDAESSTFMTGVEDKAMHSINHRPKRIGALVAFAAVVVLIVVLIVAGMHSNPPASKHPSSGTATTVTTSPTPSHRHAGVTGAAGHKGHPKSTTTTTTVAPVVSAPAPTSANAATYQLGVTTYSLTLSATSGNCWVSATDAGSGAVLFTGVLTAGSAHTVAATGPVTIVAGAPADFAATVNGVAVQLPFGFQAPFTMNLVTPGASAGSSPTSTTTTA